MGLPTYAFLLLAVTLWLLSDVDNAEGRRGRGGGMMRRGGGFRGMSSGRGFGGGGFRGMGRRSRGGFRGGGFRGMGRHRGFGGRGRFRGRFGRRHGGRFHHPCRHGRCGMWGDYPGFWYNGFYQQPAINYVNVDYTDNSVPTADQTTGCVDENGNEVACDY